MAKLTTAEFIEAIKELSVLELNELVKACEEEFGVSAAAGVVVAAAGPAEEVEVQVQADTALLGAGRSQSCVHRAGFRFPGNLDAAGGKQPVAFSARREFDKSLRPGVDDVQRAREGLSAVAQSI